MAEGQRDGEGIPEQVTSEIFTAANVVSFVRLCLVPVYLWLLLSGFNLAATLVFAAAAASDFIDGQLAGAPTRYRSWGRSSIRRWIASS